MRKLVAIAVAAVVTLSGAALTWAQPEGPCCGPDEGMAAIWKLDLSDQQRAKLAELKLKFAKETLPVRNELGVRRLELRQLMMADEPDQKAINAKIDEIKKLEATLQKKRVAHRLAMLKVLTPKQRKTLKKVRLMGFGKHRMKGMHGGKECRMMHGKPEGPMMEKHERMMRMP